MNRNHISCPQMENSWCLPSSLKKEEQFKKKKDHGVEKVVRTEHQFISMTNVEEGNEMWEWVS